jgi:hypothetical protein
VNFVKAEAVGEYAFREVNHPQAGQVFGVTSAGVFLKAMASGRILFLTEGRRRGPVSINLPGGGLALVRPGDPARLGGGSLALPEAGLVVQVEPGQVWRPPEPEPGVRLDEVGARARLERLAAALLAARPGKGLGWLLSAWVAGSAEVDAVTDPLGIFARVRQVADGLAERDPEKTAEAAAHLLGYGPGLTPSGDDFILGMILIINRWFAREWGAERLGELNRRVVAAAQKATTALSATLIECAAAGQADEALLMAADSLACGAGEEEECVEGLLGWGSNSGIDTLAGMGMVIGPNGFLPGY